MCHQERVLVTLQSQYFQDVKQRHSELSREVVKGRRILCLILFEDGLFLHCREHGIRKVHGLPRKKRTSSSCVTRPSGDDVGVVNSGFVVAGVVVLLLLLSSPGNGQDLFKLYLLSLR